VHPSNPTPSTAANTLSIAPLAGALLSQEQTKYVAVQNTVTQYFTLELPLLADPYTAYELNITLTDESSLESLDRVCAKQREHVQRRVLKLNVFSVGAQLGQILEVDAEPDLRIRLRGDQPTADQ
jgi:hypothetical protein